MKVALRYVARLLTEDNTCSAIYDVAMVSHSLPSVPPRWSSPHGRSGCFAMVISGTVLTSLDFCITGVLKQVYASIIDL